MTERSGNYGSTNVTEHDVAHKRFLCILRSVWVVVIVLAAEPDTNGTGHILHHNVGECEIFDAGSSSADLDRAAVSFVDQAIRYRDILRSAAAETEDGPACAERAIAYGNKFIAAE